MNMEDSTVLLDDMPFLLQTPLENSITVHNSFCLKVGEERK